MAKRFKQIKAFGGFVHYYHHYAETTNCPMTFTVYLPAQAFTSEKRPVLYWLSGLTCTHENFILKAGALKEAARLGLVIVCPDTSPRETDLPGEHDSWDFGSGAGFYVNATQSPWDQHYRMYDYVVHELPEVAQSLCSIDGSRQAISGHSMGGHGALVAGLNNPQRYHSISAFAPMASAINSPWGQKALSRYLGDDPSVWQPYDAAYLLANCQPVPPVKIDQGDADGFLTEQLKPELLSEAAKANHVPLELNMRSGYDHSYFFISTFIDEHLQFHAKHLGLFEEERVSWLG